MTGPVIVPREAHAISRRNIDPEALKVLYRLKEHGYTAYLVGGSVRDLLLGRRPKDFDIGTDAHPYQIKKLFRNCWIIGRRFRLAHIKFGTKTIEVATFRKNVTVDASGEAPPADEPPVVASSPEPAAPELGLIHRDNTFGTPEEDAFRRDFTINGLFYDVERDAREPTERGGAPGIVRERGVERARSRVPGLRAHRSGGVSEQRGDTRGASTRSTPEGGLSRSSADTRTIRGGMHYASR